MLTTLTDRDYRHNLEITEIAFGYDDGYLLVIATRWLAMTASTPITS